MIEQLNSPVGLNSAIALVLQTGDPTRNRWLGPFDHIYKNENLETIGMKHLSNIAIVALLLLAGNAIMAQTVQTNAAAETSPDPAIVDKLREIVTIRQNLAEANQRAVQNGKGTTDGSYELALAKARLKLAREQGLRNEQVAALKDALNVQQHRLEEAKRNMQVGAAAPEDVETIRVAVLKAEVRLLRAQKRATKR